MVSIVKGEGFTVSVLVRGNGGKQGAERELEFGQMQRLSDLRMCRKRRNSDVMPRLGELQTEGIRTLSILRI